jgi:excisionase family DNA binding protein
MLTVAQVCKVLAVSKQMVYKLVREGKLPAFRIGDFRFLPADVDAFIERGMEGR